MKKFFREIFGRIWAAWGLLVFAGTTPIFTWFYIPCFFLKGHAISVWHKKVSYIWMGLFIILTGCWLRIRGRRNFRKGETYIVVCNHNSLLDPVVSNPFMPQPNMTIAKRSFAKVPLFGLVYRFGSVLVDRDSDASRRRSFEDMKKVLASGTDMVLYPEGTRNRTGKPLKPFFNGAFRLSVETGKRIAPAVIFNTAKALPAGRTFFMLPHRLELHLLPPLSPDGKTVEELKAEVFRIMWDYYTAHTS